jgi:hypothetical protein
MRVVRAAGQNVSPSDDGRLFDQIFSDGLFTDTTFTNLGGNSVQVGAMYGDLCGRDFTIEQMTLTVTLPEGEGEVTGYIYVEIDTSSDDVITLNSALAPFTPTYEDINTNGAIAQMILAEYTATAVAVTGVTPVYERAAASAVKAGSIATVESAQATQNHAVGDYILLTGQLYVVTAAVNTGESFVEGTNISAAVIGDALTALNNGLIDVFSYDERKVGTWVDGKPLYRKTVYRSSLPNSTSTNYQHGIANVDTIFLDSGHSFIRWSSGSTAPLPYLSTSYSSAVDVNSVSSTTYTVNTHGTDRSALSGYFTFLYTKTTD